MQLIATTPLEQNKLEIVAAFLKALVPQEKLSIVEFATRFVSLPPGNNPFPGLYDIDRTPFYRDIFRDLEDPAVEEVIVMKGFQIGMTLVAIIYVLWRMVYEPTSILFVQPTEADSKKFIQDKLKPLFRDCEPLQRKIRDLSDKKSTDKDTLHRIQFPGGILNVGHAHSPNSLRSITVEVLIRDENSSYPVNVKGQGDPNFVSWGRTAGYQETRKILTFSTPAQGISCRITNLSNDRYTERVGTPLLPCPVDGCGHYQQVTWETLRWREDYPDQVSKVCQECGVESSERAWKAGYGSYRFDQENATNLKRKKRSYFISCLYAPYGGFSWGDAVQLYYKSKTDKSNKIAFVNNVLGMPYYDTTESLDHEYLYSRVDTYRNYPLPVGVDIVTAGVDVNGDFIAIELIGWGYDFRSWSLDYIHLKNASPYQAKTWQRLHKVLQRTFQHSSGSRIPIAATAIDSGHATQEVYDFVRGKESECIIAVRGSAGANKPILGRPSTNNLGKVQLYSVGQDACSATIFARLRIDDPAASGYCRFPRRYKNATGSNEYKRDYFKEMTSEHCVVSYRKGYAKMEWRKKDENARNEAFDCRKYGYAALYLFEFDDFNEFLDQYHSRVPEQAQERGYRRA